jgi:hypothetical protein
MIVNDDWGRTREETAVAYSETVSKRQILSRKVRDRQFLICLSYIFQTLVGLSENSDIYIGDKRIKIMSVEN